MIDYDTKDFSATGESDGYPYFMGYAVSEDAANKGLLFHRLSRRVKNKLRSVEK